MDRRACVYAFRACIDNGLADLSIEPQPVNNGRRHDLSNDGVLYYCFNPFNHSPRNRELKLDGYSIDLGRDFFRRFYDVSMSLSQN